MSSPPSSHAAQRAAWERLWRPYALGRAIPFHWLPMPSTIPMEHDAAKTARVRQRYATAGGQLVGHFGTFGRDLTELLLDILADMPTDVPA